MIKMADLNQEFGLVVKLVLTTFLWQCKLKTQSWNGRENGLGSNGKLTLYTLTSVFIFSMLFSVHILMCWQGEFVLQSRVSLVMIISFILMKLMWFSGDIVRRNKMLVTLRSCRMATQRMPHEVNHQRDVKKCLKCSSKISKAHSIVDKVLHVFKANVSQNMGNLEYL